MIYYSLETLNCMVKCSIDTKMTEIKREKDTLSRSMTAVESSQSFISKTYDENIRMNKEVNN
jgi:hypothetical protein